MSKSKEIEELDPLTTSADNDLVVIDDVSEDETKKQTKENLLKEVQADIDDHIGDTSNPHQVDQWVMDATPTGTVNGSNTVFTLSEEASQVVVYADGIRVKGAGQSYTFDGSQIITFEDGLQPFSTISVDYLPA